MKDGPIHTEAPAAMDQRLWAYYSHCLTSDVRNRCGLGLLILSRRMRSCDVPLSVRQLNKTVTYRGNTVYLVAGGGTSDSRSTQRLPAEQICNLNDVPNIQSIAIWSPLFKGTMSMLFRHPSIYFARAC